MAEITEYFVIVNPVFGQSEKHGPFKTWDDANAFGYKHGPLGLLWHVIVEKHTVADPPPPKPTPPAPKPPTPAPKKPWWKL